LTIDESRRIVGREEAKMLRKPLLARVALVDRVAAVLMGRIAE
jgi:hypothetical protein